MILEIERLEQDITLVRLKGRLDAAAAPGLLARLTGAISDGRILRLAAPGSQVRKLLRLTTLDRVFAVQDAPEAA
jgi:anti-anti-sigma regulatory factor